MTIETLEIDDHASKPTDPRYERLMEATRDAARNGYDAVLMRNLAETCRISMNGRHDAAWAERELLGPR